MCFCSPKNTLHPKQLRHIRVLLSFIATVMKCKRTPLPIKDKLFEIMLFAR